MGLFRVFHYTQQIWSYVIFHPKDCRSPRSNPRQLATRRLASVSIIMPMEHDYVGGGDGDSQRFYMFVALSNTCMITYVQEHPTKRH